MASAMLSIRAVGAPLVSEFEQPALLEVEHLSVVFRTEDGMVNAVSDVSFRLERGEVLAVVGESGSGKSVMALSLLQLHPRNATITGQARFGGVDLLTLDDDAIRAVRGNSIAMIFQDPMTALNPVFTVGSQIAEAVQAHRRVGKRAAVDRAIELLDLVGVPEPRRRAAQFPHEFSGGMRQRAMIAMAMSNDPDLLIADEPTTALDVTVQAQVMEVLREVQAQTGAAILLITHDLGLVAGSADRVQVMYGGRLLETAPTDELFYRSCNPYTRALLGSIPSMDSERGAALVAIPGNPPSVMHERPGCAFEPRCELRIERCRDEVPELVPVDESGHLSRCHRAGELLAGYERVVPTGVIDD
jgi:peptide/nickel transport system ATP-binding protein